VTRCRDGCSHVAHHGAARPRRATWLGARPEQPTRQPATPPATIQPTTRDVMASIGATLVTDRMNASISVRLRAQDVPAEYPQTRQHEPNHRGRADGDPHACGGERANGDQRHAGQCCQNVRAHPRAGFATKISENEQRHHPEDQEGSNGLRHGEQRGRANQQRHDDCGAQSTPQAWPSPGHAQSTAARRAASARAAAECGLAIDRTNGLGIDRWLRSAF